VPSATADAGAHPPLHPSASLPNLPPDPMDKRVPIIALNENITCKICRGYFVDPTTVTECLHTFCKSCIVKHLEEANTCPECGEVIHQSHPLDYIAFDRTMQDLVLKIVPSLEKCEYDRERSFYAERGLPCPKDQMAEESEDKKREEEEQRTPDANTNMDFHRFDEQVSLELERKDAEEEDKASNSGRVHLKRRFIRCSSLATVTHLKKFIAKKLLSTTNRYKDIEILCNDEMLYKDHTLKFVYVTRWRTKDPPMRLLFMPKESPNAPES